jgi:serine/threonine protein kinase
MKLLLQVKLDIANMKKELTIDTILQDRYQLQNLLSQKQGRTTFLALDIQTENLVIIKLVRLNLEFQWEDLKLFEREAATLQNLDHPAIPKYLDYFDVADGFALVQTYIEAPSLATLIQAGRKFTEAEVIELAERLLSILTYLHDLNPSVIHRDIKPSNILLTNRSGNSIGDLYLVDFGAVQAVTSTDGDTTTCVVGTFGYMPPEQFYGRTKTASDLYSMGMTLIHLITGIHPADLEITDGRVTFDRSPLSNRFCRWLDKMTEYSVDRRFQSARLAQTALISTDGSYGEFLNLRPANSQVELYHDLDRLEIKLLQIEMKEIQQDFISNSLFNLFLFSCFLDLVMYFGVLPQAWTLMSWSSRSIFLIFSPLTLALWNMSEKYVARKTYTGYKVLSIDRLSKTLKVGIYSKSTRNFYWTNKLPTSPKIDLLIYKPSCTIESYFDEESGKIKSGTIKTSPDLLIYMGKHEYSISNNNLSEVELQWLGKELSDFLDLKLETILPTPSIPAPVYCTHCGCV